MDSTQNFKNQFLIALPTLKGDYFANTVSLIVEHSDEGAFGLVINRPADAGIGDLFPEVAGHFACPVMEGGPVQTDQLFFLHESDRTFDGTFRLDERLCMTTSPDFIDAMRDGSAPSNTLALLGYAGWDSLQLEDEISRNVWLLAPMSFDILFETPYPERPRAAARQLGIDLNLISPIAGHD